MSTYTYIKKLAVPLMVAGLAVGIGSSAMAVPAVPTIYDSVTGRTWGLPFSVSTLPGSDYNSKLAEIQLAGYTEASVADVVAMYQNIYGTSANFGTFLSDFGFPGSSVALAFTTTGSSTTFRAVGITVGSTFCLDPVVPSTNSCTSGTNFASRGFMYYTILPTPEPSMVGLFGGMMLSMAWIAHRKLRKD